MKRRLGIWLAVICALLVMTASPASAVSVASINTTDQDFANATLDDMEIAGTGTSASVQGGVGIDSRLSTGTADATLTVDYETGLVFTPTNDQGVVAADVEPTGATTAYLRYHSNGTLIQSETITSGRVVIEGQMQAGTEYRLTVDAGGSSYQASDFDATPLSNSEITINHGITDDNAERVDVASISQLEVGPAADIRYRGSEHIADADALFANLSVGGSTTVKAQANTGSGWSTVDSTTISTDQNVSLDISGSSATRYRTVVEASEETADSYAVTLYDEGVTFTARAPVLSNPDPADGSSVDDYDGTLSVDVSDSDFGTAQGDVVTVVAENQDGTVGQTQTNTNGTVTIPYGGRLGANNITFTATDEYAMSDTLTANFTTPDGLTFVNETNTSQLVTSPITIEVDFINETNIVTKTTTTGKVSFGSLPTGESFIVRVEPSDQYHGRTVYLQSLLQQRTIYLLSQNVSSVETRFTLSDQTGEFSNRAIFSIEKAINESGTTTYRTIHSDRFGVEGVTIDLEEGQRYRTSVRSVTGVTQDTGPYRADVSETVTVRPGEPVVPVSTDNSSWDAGATMNNQTIEFRYADAEDETTKLVVWVHEKGDESNQLGVNRTYFNLGEAQGTYSLTANQSDKTWVVNFIITRDGETFTATETVANKPDLTPDLDREWRLIFGIGLLLISAGVFSVLNASIGGVVVALEGGLLWWSGWLGGATTGAAVVLALFVAIMMHLYTSRV